MGTLARAVFREILTSALLGTLLFTFVLFLQRIGKLFELLVRTSAPPSTIGYLFLLVLPQTLVFTIPVGVLVGVLLGLSRMSSDNEIVAMRASGLSARFLVRPVAVFALFGTLAAAACSLWLSPWASRETFRVLNRLVAEQLTAEIQPRIFEESFPNMVLFVGDVISGPVVQWRKVFIADVSPPDERKGGTRDQGEQPRITTSASAIAVPDIANNRLQLSLRDGHTHELGKDPSTDYNTFFPQGDQALEAQKKNDVPVKPLIQIDTVPLAFAAYPQPGKPPKVALSGEPGQTPVDARIELHQRFAMPLACVLLALVGVPLGVTQHKAGKSFAFVMTVALAFFYYMSSISLIGLARKGTLRPEIAVWLPDAILILLGIFLVSRLEKARRIELGTYLRTLWDEWRTGRRQRQARREAESARPLGPARRLRLFPHIIDTYILTTFLFYFFLLLSSFVLMTEVFTFFELLSDIVKNKIPMGRVLTYLVFLTPKLVYDSTPVSVLVAVLVTFGVLTKNNEVTAFKASGISLYRLAMPVLVASGAFSILLFAFDHTILPDANRKQDAIRDEIKGRPRQTYLRPDRKWIMGRSGNRIYYYKGYDPWEHVMVNVSVYDLDPATFHLTRIITAERARWEPGLKNWVFQDGWRRTIQGTRVVDFQDFRGATATYAEIDEPPGYFLKEVKLHTQMNFQELAGYISELRQSGFDTIRLQVQLQNKFAVPLFALIMAMISVPFAFLTGNRGAMAGVGVSFGIAIAYFAVSRLFEQIGNVAQLPPAMAAWSPDMLFSLAGLYLLARMRT